MKAANLFGFEIFPWNKHFKTGVAEIDRQHQKLVLILNQLAFYLGHNAEEADLNYVFNELAGYADYHFKCEEVIWRKYLKGDPSFEEHLATHSSFMKQVIKLKEEEATLPIDEVIENILKFLSRWLAVHILSTDAQMAKTILGIEAGLSLSEAKAQAESEMSGEKVVLIEAILLMYEQLSTRTLSLMREKSERRKAEADERAVELYCLLDESLKLTGWNQAFIQAVGYTSEALPSMCFLDFFKGEACHAISDNMKLKQSPITFDSSLVSKSGQKTLFRFSVTSIFSAEGDSILIKGTSLKG